MAPVLPSSLSPHVCVLSSPDLVEILLSSALPPLPHILQSFSPLPQVITRTTSLESVPHASFALRFSDLVDVETACKEDEEERAIRTVDWISARINKQSARWVEDLEKLDVTSHVRTPWWDDIKRCSEGDHVPNRTEGWNHPAAVILAASTNAPNPLQAITNLHARPLDFPPWVDTTLIRYVLIIHPQNSSLTDEEAIALLNAVKKQYGLNCYLLSLVLPQPPPPPVPVPALLPRLSPPHVPSSPILQPQVCSPSPSTFTYPNSLSLGEKDISQTAKFVKEFVGASLVPFMEKCVLEWSESFSSNRRLPSRLFSSTRRLFGSPSPSPTAGHSASSSVSSLPSRSNTYNGASNGFNPSSAITQHRRLAEFATILGDFKLAVNVWESLRKEGKGGWDILPLLLTPSPTVPLHASHALSTLYPSINEPSAHAQIRALAYAVRWEVGIGHPEFFGSTLEGERWLVWAAGLSEEPHSALLLAHAAFLSSRKRSIRRAALWYVSAANRLEKCGIKPLTMYFFRRAHAMYASHIPKLLSPSFWESEGKDPDSHERLASIMSGIEHPLGRLLYTTGDIHGAVKYFLGLLTGFRSPPAPEINHEQKASTVDKVFLDDFRVAFSHYKSISGGTPELGDLLLPFTLSLARQTKLRLPRHGSSEDESTWCKREEDWISFWRSQGGKESLAKTQKVSVNETFWVDLFMQNPLEAEINLTNITVVAQESSQASASQILVEAEVVGEVILGPWESRSIPIAIKLTQPAYVTITHAVFDFLGILPIKEVLSYRGRRLHDTQEQRITPTYASDIHLMIDVADASHKLFINFVDDRRLVLAQGECVSMSLWFSNAGSTNVDEIWMISGPDDVLWLENAQNHLDQTSLISDDVLRSSNSLAIQKPLRLYFNNKVSLQSGESASISVVLHADNLGQQELCLLFAYRDSKIDKSFHSVRVTRSYEVGPSFEISAQARPAQALDHPYYLGIRLRNASLSIPLLVSQMLILSPTWKTSSLRDHVSPPIAPLQVANIALDAKPWNGGTGVAETYNFVSRNLKDILQGSPLQPSKPPPIDVLCHRVVTENASSKLFEDVIIRHFIHSSRRKAVACSLAVSHPHIHSKSRTSLFPLYNPSAVDLVLFWEIEDHKRTGYLYVHGIALGAGHGALQEILEVTERKKPKRSMYAETRRERQELFESIRESEWNVEMNPIVIRPPDKIVAIHDLATSPYSAFVTFTLRNYSLTHASNYLLNLVPDPTKYESQTSCMPPPYYGRVIFRGTLQPKEQTSLRARVWITRQGSYSLGGWRLRTEVLGIPSSGASNSRSRVPCLYEQEGPLTNETCITVCNS